MHIILSIFLSLINIAILSAQMVNIPARPEPKNLVNDLAGVLVEPRRTEALEYKLRKYEDSCGVEIFAVIVESLDKIDVESYAGKLADKWEDSNDKINGVFILYDYEDRGYAIIPGSKFKEKFGKVIIDKIENHFLKPHFKKGEYYEGFNEAADAIVNHVSGKLSDKELKSDDKYNKYPYLILILLFFLILYPIIMFVKFNKHHFGSKKLGFMSAFMLISHIKPSHSSYDDFKTGQGAFSTKKIAGSKLTSFGGGAGGSWGGW